MLKTITLIDTSVSTDSGLYKIKVHARRWLPIRSLQIGLIVFALIITWVVGLYNRPHGLAFPLSTMLVLFCLFCSDDTLLPCLSSDPSWRRTTRFAAFAALPDALLQLKYHTCVDLFGEEVPTRGVLLCKLRGKIYSLDLGGYAIIIASKHNCCKGVLDYTNKTFIVSG